MLREENDPMFTVFLLTLLLHEHGAIFLKRLEELYLSFGLPEIDKNPSNISFHSTAINVDVSPRQLRGFLL